MSPGGALDASVTLDEVLSVLETKRVPLAPELAGYLVLEIAEHADPEGGDLDPRRVFVGEEGTVALVKPKREAAGGSAEASVRSVLARLLEASGAQTPALSAASKRQSGAGLPALAEELEAALIPVNRAAGRRALARLAREVRRVTLGVGRNALPSTSDATAAPRRTLPSSNGLHLTPPPSDRIAARMPSGFGDDEEPTAKRADALVTEAAPPSGPPTPGAPRSRSASQADVDALIEQFGASTSPNQHANELRALAGLDPTPAPPSAGTAARAVGRVAPGHLSDIDVLLASPATAADGPDPRDLPTRPTRLRPSAAPARPTRAPRRSGISPAVWGLSLLAIAGGAYAAWRLRPPPARPVDAPSRSAPALVPPAPSVPVQATPACRGTLVVSNAPTSSEVLLREGQAPVDVEKMPVGARLEFVATAEGYAPKRVVVPAGTAWDVGQDGKPRVEAAVQLDRAKGATETWPASEPGTEVGGAGAPGTVHVVSTPRGAEIWLVAGVGPEAKIDQIRCDRDVDVLVAGPGAYRRRVHVSPRDFVSDEAAGGRARIARVSVK